MIRRLSPVQLEKLLRKYRAQLDRTNGTGGADLARIGTRIERRIVREMLNGSGPVSDEQLQAFQRAIRQSIAMGDAGFQETMAKHVPDVWTTALNRTVDSIGIMAAGERTIDAVVQVSEKFERDIADKSILRLGNQLGLWRDQWNDEFVRTARVVQSRFTAATITGESWETVARGLTDDLGNLNVQGRMSVEAFAEMFVRTKFTELDNAAGIHIADEIGLDEFINAGIPDELQAEECYDASQEEPMTLEQWAVSGYLQAPRHFNCRCFMLPVTPGTKWDGMPNKTIEEKRSRKAEEVAA